MMKPQNMPWHLCAGQGPEDPWARRLKTTAHKLVPPLFTEIYRKRRKCNYASCTTVWSLNASTGPCLEDALRNSPDDGHDRPPEPGHVDDILASTNSVQNAGCHLFRSGEKAVLRNVRGHRGGDKAGLDGKHLHPGAIAAVAQAGEEGVERCLRGSVDVVALAAPVAGDGADDRKGTPALGFAIVRQPGQQRDGREKVGDQDRLRGE